MKTLFGACALGFTCFAAGTTMVSPKPCVEGVGFDMTSPQYIVAALGFVAMGVYGIVKR